MYDYGKVYQSVIGYDFILNDRDLDNKVIQKVEQQFFENIEAKENMSLIKHITLLLYFTLLPLHDDDKKIEKFYELLHKLFNSLNTIH